MNYDHAFHAGNFADLLKHAVLTEALETLLAGPGPLTIIDTHAGAGLYDIGGGPAARTGEAANGVQKLMASTRPPPALAALIAAVRAVNRGPDIRSYPGSPRLVADALRPGDRLIACELRPEAAASLAAGLAARKGVEVVAGDGWKTAIRRVPPPPARVLALIDPPYESAGDGRAAAAATRAILGRNGSACLAVWAPLKDLATWDALLGDLEDGAGDAPMVVAEVRLRPLTDPTRMNGCAMVVANPPRGIAEAALQAAQWIAVELGETGGLARVRRREGGRRFD